MFCIHKLAFCALIVSISSLPRFLSKQTLLQILPVIINVGKNVPKLLENPQL
jgi:hypothetical protein